MANEVKVADTINLRHLLSACYDLSGRAAIAISAIFDSGQLYTQDKTVSGAAASAAAAAGASPVTTPPSVVAASSSSSSSTTSSSSASSVSSSPQKKAKVLTSNADPFDPVTIADTTSQKIIIGSLTKLFPTLKIVGEEGELENDEKLTVTDLKLNLLDAHVFPPELLALSIKDIALWVDPLDGTKEYTLGIKDAVTVLMGVSYQGRPLAGVVGVPFSNRVIWGAIGVGAFGYTRVVPSIGRRWIATSRSHMTPKLQQLIAHFRVEKMIQQGGAGSKGLMVLEGKADAYFFPQDGTKKWDTCAINAIFLAIGASFSDAYGTPIDYTPSPDVSNARGLLATMDAATHRSFTCEETLAISKF